MGKASLRKSHKQRSVDPSGSKPCDSLCKNILDLRNSEVPAAEVVCLYVYEDSEMSVARTEAQRRVVKTEVCVSRGETPWLFLWRRWDRQRSVLSRQVWILLLLEDSFAGPGVKDQRGKKRRNQEGGRQ